MSWLWSFDYRVTWLNEYEPSNEELLMYDQLNDGLIRMKSYVVDLNE
jgi:hypothetical protein